MAQIKFLPFVRHVRSDPSRHLMLFRRGRLRRSGRGLAFWFTPLSASLVEVPCDDREVSFLFNSRSQDFQEIHVQGSITYRVVDPERLAGRVDFTIHPFSGQHLEQPLDRLEELFTQLAQKLGAEYVTTHAVATALSEGQRAIRLHIEKGLSQSRDLEAMGLAPVVVHVAAVSPSAELEKALQAPTRESIQQRSDEAVFQRRALAVEKERAIRENELQNQIELARQEEHLIHQEGQNAQQRETEAAEAGAIAARSEAARERLHAETEAEALRARRAAEAEGIEAVEGARVEAEGQRIGIYRELPPHVLLGLAARDFARKLQRIERIQLTPDGIGPLLSDLADAGTRLLERTAARSTEEAHG